MANSDNEKCGPRPWELEGWRAWGVRAEVNREMPVSGDTIIQARLRDGSEKQGEARYGVWSHTGGPSDIVAYRVVYPVSDPAELRRLHALNQELLEALKEAHDSVESWGGYASDYFQRKHDLAGDIERIRAAIAKAEGGK